MNRIKSLIINSVLAVTLVLLVAATIVVVTNFQAAPANADDGQAATATTITASETTVEYLPLTDAPPVRDITQQRFAPLE